MGKALASSDMTLVGLYNNPLSSEQHSLCDRRVILREVEWRLSILKSTVLLVVDKNPHLVPMFQCSRLKIVGVPMENFVTFRGPTIFQLEHWNTGTLEQWNIGTLDHSGNFLGTSLVRIE